MFLSQVLPIKAAMNKNMGKCCSVTIEMLHRKVNLGIHYLVVFVCLGVFIRQAVNCIQRFIDKDTAVHHDLQRYEKSSSYL